MLGMFIELSPLALATETIDKVCMQEQEQDMQKSAILADS